MVGTIRENSVSSGEEQTFITVQCHAFRQLAGDVVPSRLASLASVWLVAIG